MLRPVAAGVVVLKFVVLTSHPGCTRATPASVVAAHVGAQGVSGLLAE
jgi:hypothetical protein